MVVDIIAVLTPTRVCLAILWGWHLKGLLVKLVTSGPLLLLPFLKQKVKRKKYSHEHIHRKTVVMVSFVVQFAALRANNFMKRGLHLRCFCEICEVLHNLIFTGGSWTTASHCCISNKSNPDCLSRTSTMSCSQAIHSVCLENI